MKRLLALTVVSLFLMSAQTGYAADAGPSYNGGQSAEERQADRRAERRAERRADRREERRAVARSVPELDGGFALIALGLVAGIVLVVRERRAK